MDATAATMDVTGMAKTLLENAQSGNWRGAVAIALMLTVWGVRKGLLRPKLDTIPYVGKLLAWFKTDRGGVALTILLAAVGAVGTTLAAHVAITAKLLVSTAVNAAIAAGTFAMTKRTFKPADKKGPMYNLLTDSAKVPLETPKETA